MKIAFFELEEWEKQIFQKELSTHELEFYDNTYSGESLNAEIIATFVHSNFYSFDKLPNLKFIATMSTGFDHINLQAAKDKNILVSNVPAYGENTVAEYALSLLLSLSRKIPQTYLNVKRGKFSNKGLRGFDLKGKTIGIIGCGHIGKHMAQLCKALEMNVFVYDPFPNQEIAEDIGFQFVDFDKLLEQSDVISLHAPYNNHTHHMINNENISKIKPGCVLINTARGGLIETDAILKGLNQGIFSLVGLDSLEEENVLKEEHLHFSEILKKDIDFKTVYEDHLLIEDDRVIITPHNAFNTQEALQRILEVTLENIQSFIDGKAKNLVQ